MNRRDPHAGQKRFACSALTILTVALIALIAWSGRPVERSYPPVGAAEEASPSTDPTEEAFRATMWAWANGTEVPTPTATVPPRPTITPIALCTSALSSGRMCKVATLVPTPYPTRVAQPLPTWPGTARETPGMTYQMGMTDEFDDYPR